MTREVFPGIVVDPEIEFGEPCESMRFVRVRTLVSLFSVGASVDVLARDFDIPKASVEAAIRWALLSPGARRKRLGK